MANLTELPTSTTDVNDQDAAHAVATEELVHEVEDIKATGNEHFRSAEWHDALSSYLIALERLPKRRNQRKDPVPEPDDDDEDVGQDVGQTGTSTTKPSTPEQSDVEENPLARDPSIMKLRAVLNANIAACHVKLDCYKEAVDACSQAIVDDPKYVKALQRRAAANEHLNTWSSLSSAQEDYKSLLTLLPEGSPQHRDTQRLLRALTPRVEASQKAETAEMLGKLKNLGNSILGNFGLSTDNFKFEPNGQGGYSMQFTQ